MGILSFIFFTFLSIVAIVGCIRCGKLLIRALNSMFDKVEKKIG